MCIIYFASHQTCDHRHFLGAWNCGLNCPTNSRHTFHLEDKGFECQTCVFLHGKALDPDINPVTYYPPRFDTDKLPEEEEEPKDYVPSNASLSDLHGLTSKWRYDSAAVQDDNYTGHIQQDFSPTASQDDYTQPQVTPRMVAHRNLVQDQLKKLPLVVQMVPPPLQGPPMVMFYDQSAWQTMTGSLPLRTPITPIDEKDEKEESKG
jgi:hypothetical protein